MISVVDSVSASPPLSIYIAIKMATTTINLEEKALDEI